MTIREATHEDVLRIVEMIADDELGKTRENLQIPLPAAYQEAFDQIKTDPNQELPVVEDEDHEIIGTM